MARSIGIDPGDRNVKVVEIDGSYRKTRLVRVHSAPAAGADDDPMHADNVAAGVREAIDAGMKGDATLGFPCREAVLRTLELPFKGADAIKKVVKSEIEGEIYTHSVDDMVVDFHEIGEGSDGGTRIMVAAVPKDGLRQQLEAFGDHGVEPEVVDLDTMALWRVAHWAGAFEEDDDADEQGDDETVHAVLDLGARSVRVLVVEGEQLVEMRALRIGDSVVCDQIARQYGLDPERAQAAVAHSLTTGADIEIAAAARPQGDEQDDAGDAGEDAFGADGGEADGQASQQLPAVADGELVTVPHGVVEAAHTKYLQRLARELTRFLTASGTAARISRVWVTGAASRGQGVQEMLAAVFGVDPVELDLLGNLQHDLDDDEIEELAPQLATALGLALGPLGGPEGFQLRQEDLALVHGFEAVKFPLALACMVALLLMFVYGNKLMMERKQLEYQIGRRYQDPENPNAVIFHGMLNPIFYSEWFKKDQYFRLESRSGKKDYKFSNLTEEVLAAPVYDRLKIVRNQLKKVADQKQKQSGIYEDISLESGLAVMVRWAEILKGVEPDLGRYLVPSIKLSMKLPSRYLEFRVAFRGSDFRARMSTLKQAIESDMQRRESPFGQTDKKKLEVSEDLFDDKDNVGISGAYFDITIPVKPQFAAF